MTGPFFSLLLHAGIRWAWVGGDDLVTEGDFVLSDRTYLALGNRVETW